MFVPNIICYSFLYSSWRNSEYLADFVAFLLLAQESGHAGIGPTFRIYNDTFEKSFTIRGEVYV